MNPTMFKKIIFNLLSAIFLFIVFLYFGINSWNKFAEKHISTEVIEKRVDNITYPSLTVCPEKSLRYTNRLPNLNGTLLDAENMWKNSIR